MTMKVLEVMENDGFEDIYLYIYIEMNLYICI